MPVILHKKGESKLYIYPENMTAKATLWMWTLRDLTISGTLLLMGFLMFAYLHTSLVMVIGATYAFLAIRFGDICILDYLRHAAQFCFGQRLYLWGRLPADDRKGKKVSK